MSPPKVVLYSLALVGVLGKFSKFTELIRRVHARSDSDTLYFYRMDGGFVGSFLKAQMDILPVVISSESGGYFQHNAILVVQADSDETHQHRETLQQIIGQLRTRKFVIIFASNVQNLHRYFLFFAENKFTWIFGVAENVSYAYLPYASERVQEVPPNGPFQDPLKDLNGYVFRTVLPSVIPHTFWYLDKRGSYEIGGYAGRVFVHFLKRHNATFRDVSELDFASISFQDFSPGVFKATMNGEMDINIYPLSGLDYSYPFKLNSYTILVPYIHGVDSMHFYLRPFSPGVWIALGVGILLITLMDVLKDFCTNAPLNAWNSFSRTYLEFLCMAPPKKITTHYRFHIPVLLLAFILFNLYMAHFTSFHTVLLQPKQHETIQDVIDNNVPVKIPAFEWTLVIKNSYASQLDGLKKVVKITDRSLHAGEIYSMNNTKYCYAVNKITAKFLISWAKKRLFHLTRDSFFYVHMGFIFTPHFPFREILDTFIIQIYETGLLIKWDRDVFEQVLTSGVPLNYQGNVQAAILPSAYSIHDLGLGWSCLGIGWTLALVVLAIEQAVSRMGCQRC